VPLDTKHVILETCFATNLLLASRPAADYCPVLYFEAPTLDVHRWASSERETACLSRSADEVSDGEPAGPGRAYR